MPFEALSSGFFFWSIWTNANHMHTHFLCCVPAHMTMDANEAAYPFSEITSQMLNVDPAMSKIWFIFL